MGTKKDGSKTSLEDGDGPVDVSEEVDVEKNGPTDGLERQVSGPPYTIWGRGAKIWIISLVSVAALISPFGATLFLPTVNVLSDVLNITPTQTNFSITTYMVSQIFATVGRYHVANTFRLLKPSLQHSWGHYLIIVAAD
jgi:hypothetical protein